MRSANGDRLVSDEFQNDFCRVEVAIYLREEYNLYGQREEFHTMQM
jgi:hypothetical protein